MTHYVKRVSDMWSACGKRVAVMTYAGARNNGVTANKFDVTCPACLTHVRKVETPA